MLERNGSGGGDSGRARITADLYDGIEMWLVVVGFSPEFDVSVS